MTRYTWTSKGQLESVVMPDGIRVEYRYDAFWRRTQKTVVRDDRGTARTVSASRFVWDGDKLLHEVRRAAEAAGDPVVEEKTFVFEDARWTPLAHREIRRHADGSANATPWWHYVNDQVGAPTALLRSDGTAACEIEHSVYGLTTSAAGPEGAETPLRYLGQFADEETGLCYNRFRYYDPDAGIYISADPIGIVGGFNAFQYAVDPMGWADPLGLDPTPNMQMGEALEQQRTGVLTSPPNSMTILPSKVGSGNGIDILAVKKEALHQV